ncbi:MAG TPA: AI-2E family transporter [Tepidisphaeraceae bacterium]|jgi:predicted PurR-regulated permease PerM|nr:AI-2E family transporter [Tepidisphaeraceae bacterium]
MDGARTDNPQRAVRIIAGISVVATLYFARDILIPASLAVLLAFLLNPIVERLTRWRLNRAVAVGITVLLAMGVVGAVGYVVGQQVVDLSEKVPEYRGNLVQKVRSLRTSTNGTFSKLTSTISDLKQEITATQPAGGAATQTSTTIVPQQMTSPPVQVEVVNDGPDFLQLFSQFAPPILVPIATGAIVILLLIFLLLYSEEVRERLVWFAGMRQISLTTAAMDEAAQRIGGYLRMQAMVNFAYGVMVTLGLALFGVPTALLWGTLAGLLRFVPYLGPWIAGILPTLLAIAVFQGWRVPIEVMVMFAVVELVTNMLLEPWLYGKSTGISSLGVVCATIFWAWLWGPVGLILAVPLTVCLLVIGKQVPQLALLNHLFGESLEMPHAVRLYQRLLIGDDLTSGKIIDKELKEGSFAEACETLFMPVLQELKRDMQLGMIDQAQARRAMQILDMATSESTPAESATPKLLLVAAQNEVDDMAATLLARAAGADGVATEVVSSQALASEAVEHAREAGVNMLCLVQVSPISWTHCRHLAKTLASRLPEVAIYVANIEAGEDEAPFEVGSGQLPGKRLFRSVKAVMDRVREMRFVEPESHVADVA